MMLDTECSGEMSLLADGDCGGGCEEDKTFIVI